MDVTNKAAMQLRDQIRWEAGRKCDGGKISHSNLAFYCHIRLQAAKFSTSLTGPEHSDAPIIVGKTIKIPKRLNWKLCIQIFWVIWMYFVCTKKKKNTKKQPTQAYYQHFVVYKNKNEINEVKLNNNKHLIPHAGTQWPRSLPRNPTLLWQQVTTVP